jgi:hypothetical protein
MEFNADQNTQDEEGMLTMTKKEIRQISVELQNFFGAETRNENDGGVRPATLGSAKCSWNQAPADVKTDWCGLSQQQFQTGELVKRLDAITSEFSHLIERFGPERELASLD